MISKGFIAYLTLGDGGLDYSLDVALALVEGGVDLIEIGLPFSDPVADGPVIQQAMERSLKRGTQTKDLIPFLHKFRQISSIPVVVFSYYNPVLAAGDDFLMQAKTAGANGLLIVDLPFEQFPKSPLDPILVVSPSTSDARLKQIANAGRGFLYYACQKGTTGMRSDLPAHFSHDVARIKQVSALPVVVGFGISNKKTAAMALESADGFVVGSYFVEAIGHQVPAQQFIQLAQNIDPRRAL